MKACGSIYVVGYQLQANSNFLQPAIRTEVYLDPSSLQRGGNARLGRNYCATPYVINDPFPPPGTPEPTTNSTLDIVVGVLVSLLLLVLALVVIIIIVLYCLCTQRTISDNDKRDSKSHMTVEEDQGFTGAMAIELSASHNSEKKLI